MDPLHAWKDDFSREVEEVIASRARTHERGDVAPVEGFGGRLADLVIPPAGAYAELRDAQRDLEQARAEIRELKERLEEKDARFEREREVRERMKDGLTRLAMTLRDERAARAAARDEAKKAWQDVEGAFEARDTARFSADQSAARAEDWEREAMARQNAGRELQARLDRVMLGSDAQDAEIASLRARLDAALQRAQTSEREFAGSRADAASRESLAARLELERADAQREADAAAARTVRAEGSERVALARLAALESEVRTMTATSAGFEREAQRLVEEISKAREDAAGAQARERAAGQALAAERSRVLIESAGMVERAEALRVEGERALDKARRLEAELPARLEDALRDERARLHHETEAAAEELQLARQARRDAAARMAETEVLLNETRAAAMREAREQGQTAYAQGLSVAQTHAEHAERALEASRRAEAAAAEKARFAITALGEYRDRMRIEIMNLTAATKQERERGEAAVAAARKAESMSQARLVAELSRREAALEEERAILRAEFEDTRAKLEDEMDAERRALRERWKEQTDAFDRLRKDLERGKPGT